MHARHVFQVMPGWLNSYKRRTEFSSAKAEEVKVATASSASEGDLAEEAISSQEGGAPSSSHSDSAAQAQLQSPSSSTHTEEDEDGIFL